MRRSNIYADKRHLDVRECAASYGNVARIPIAHRAGLHWRHREQFFHRALGAALLPESEQPAGENDTEDH